MYLNSEGTICRGYFKPHLTVIAPLFWYTQGKFECLYTNSGTFSTQLFKQKPIHRIIVMFAPTLKSYHLYSKYVSFFKLLGFLQLTVFKLMGMKVLGYLLSRRLIFNLFKVVKVDCTFKCMSISTEMLNNST